jgi:predicted phosphodiesterase
MTLTKKVPLAILTIVLYQLRIVSSFISTRRTLQPRFSTASNSALHSSVQHNVLDDVNRIFCLSDLHVDHAGNREWLEDKCGDSGLLKEGDLLIVAGDVSHKDDRLRDTFQTLQSTGCRIIYCSGNHEAWVGDEDASSYEKLQRVEDLCRELGVLVDPTLVTNCDEPLWIVPLQSWYDASLSIADCEDLCVDFPGWPWTDFRACRWSDHPADSSGGTNGKIPIGLADHFHEQNLEVIDFIKDQQQQGAPSAAAIMTMSHFLPTVQCLPDWKDVTSDTFLRNEWLDHGAPGTSAKFAKVAGSTGLEAQIRSIGSDVHVFGHSHRPKDFVREDIRYVHNPLGNPRERLMYMVSPDATFQLLWDTRTGQVSDKEIIRLWEEQGGGIPALRERLDKHGRKRPRVKNSRRII